MDETERQSEERGWDTAKTLAEALPYIQIYDRETVVVKYGGHAMGDSAVARQFAADIVLLKLMGVNPVVVHGGGPQISAMLDRAGVRSAFVDGLRVTDADTMTVAEMVLSGAVNKEIAHWITVAGKEADVRGVGLSGKDAGLLTVEKTRRTKRDPDSMIEHEVDLGFVGEPTRVDPKLIDNLIQDEKQDWVPVIAPIGVAEDGLTYNVNADTVAGALAGALTAKRMLLLTDVPGVKGADGQIIRQMTVGEASRLIEDGVATGGMIPKLQTAMAAVRAGVEAVVILDGRRPHAMLVELFTETGAGTLVKAGVIQSVCDLSGVRTWIFDMDDTLYPHEQGVMRLVQARISAFMIDAVGLPHDEARALQRQFLDEHGTTLAGLMANYAVDPEHFLRDVHDVPLDTLEPNPGLAEALARLPGRKYVMTNGARCHASRVLSRIGVTGAFDGVWCIEDMDLVPKPAPATFRRMLAHFDIDPRTAAFFEDTPRNLEPAKALGMTTVLIGDGHGKPTGDWIDLIQPDLMTFFDQLNLRDAA